MNLDSAPGRHRKHRADAVVVPGRAPAAPMNAAPKLQAQFGYGFSGRKPDRLGHPYLLSAQATGQAAQALTLGLGFTSGAHAQAGLEIGRRHNGGSSPTDIPEQAIGLTGSIRWQCCARQSCARQCRGRLQGCRPAVSDSFDPAAIRKQWRNDSRRRVSGAERRGLAVEPDQGSRR